MERLAAADEKSLEIPDLIGAASAKVIRRYFESEEGNRLWRELQSLGVNMSEPRAASTDTGPLSGKRLVVTGTVPGKTRLEVERVIKEYGGELQADVTSATDHVIVGDKPGANKIEKAKKLGKPTLSWEEFQKLLTESRPLPVVANAQDKPGGLFD